MTKEMVPVTHLPSCGKDAEIGTQLAGEEVVIKGETV